MDEIDAPATRLLAGRYELGRPLGQGGMGTVLDATDRRLARPVAVKILRADLARQPRARRRFETEAHAAARLSHPNVVIVFDSGEDDGVPFLVMERLPGRTLADELTAGPLSFERASLVASEVLSALAAAHAAGVIHRDVKPANVLHTDDGHVKVSDFGIAKTTDDLDQTQTVELFATPGYLAPERLAGEPASQRSDIYSVGVLLYEALSGKQPFTGDSPLAVMRAIESGSAEPLASMRAGLPARFVAGVERAMSRDPRQRFETAGEMADALSPPAAPAAETDTVPVPAQPGRIADTVPVDLGSRAGHTELLRPRESAAVAVAANRPRTRHRAARAATFVLALVAIVIGAFAYAHRGKASSAVRSPGTTTTQPSTVRNSSLPGALDDAIRQLEQEVSK